MNIFFDWLLILATTYIVVLAYRRIIFQDNCSIANYVLLVIYVFCVFPIILNYFIGIPQYETVYWYKPFIEPMHNKIVALIYDLYILACMLILYVVCGKKSKTVSLEEYNSLTSAICKNKLLSVILIALPVIYIALTGSWKYYAVYAVSSARGLSESNQFALMTPCMLISMVIFFGTIFKGKITVKKLIILILYSIAIVWISGKRFMLANILLLFVFFTVNSKIDLKDRKKIFRVMPILALMLIGFSAFYLVMIRPMSTTTTSSIYDMLRVDFGRDDVIKYVINKEIICKEHILEYYGETFLSLIGAFIPRKIWLGKPYPHYMYLTGSILGLDIHNLPAGTTPSLLEMTLCNFSYFGFALGVVLLILICKMIDKAKDIDSKAIGLILTMVLLTQSMDVYLVLIVVIIGYQLVIKSVGGRKIRIVIHR